MREYFHMDSLPLEITPAEVRDRIHRGEAIRLIDVRELEEFQKARIEGADLVPMQSVPAQINRLEEQSDEQTLIFFCHHGVRSLQVAAWLRGQGVEPCQSMQGGIDRWSLEIDPAVPRY